MPEATYHVLSKSFHRLRGRRFLKGFYHIWAWWPPWSCDQHHHTCDTFLNPNREIWNFRSGNLCLVSGGFHVANFGPFLPKLKSRNLVTFLEICYRASQRQHMPTEVRICVRLQFKKPPLTRTFILVYFVPFR